MNREILEFINRRQRQILVHSLLYYRMNETLISDEKFDAWARELVELQNNHPLESEKSVYHEYFKGFDATTGYDLPLWLSETERKAKQLLNYEIERVKI